ncbi:MAG: hypothetical protein R2861_17670, partial [Desulfobacterales bacterium]
EIDISREVFDYEASISGTILGDDAGAVTLVAYCGDIESSDFTTLDFNDVVGFTTITKGNTPLGYTLDILPYGKNAPIENVQIFALWMPMAAKPWMPVTRSGFTVTRMIFPLPELTPMQT